MSEKFSPESLEILEKILKSNKPYEDKNLVHFIRKDARGEVLRVQGQKVVLTMKAMRYLMDRVVGKAFLTLVDISEDAETGKSGHKNQESQDLPEGHKSE